MHISGHVTMGTCAARNQTTHMLDELGSSKYFLHTSHKTIRQFYDVSRHWCGEDNRRKYCSFDFHINWRRHFRYILSMHCAIRLSHFLRSSSDIWKWFCVVWCLEWHNSHDGWSQRVAGSAYGDETDNFAHAEMVTNSVSFCFLHCKQKQHCLCVDKR